MATIYDFEVCSFEGSTPRMKQKKAGMNIRGTKFQRKPSETDLQKQWKPPWNSVGLKGLELGHVRRQNLRKPPGCFFFSGAWYSSVFSVTSEKARDTRSWKSWKIDRSYVGKGFPPPNHCHTSMNLQGWSLCLCSGALHGSLGTKT